MPGGEKIFADMACILLVEDNPLNRELTVDLLEFGGHEVICASSGEEALELAASSSPSLILLDLSLPGKDGWTVARELKADPKLNRIPVVAVTAHAMKGDEEKARELGCCGYLSKPIDTRTFTNRVESYLNP